LFLLGPYPTRNHKGAAVVVDGSNSPSFEDTAVLNFFRTSTTNLLEAEAAAGVRHHVALSVVGTDRLSESGYMRAKIAQEKLIEQSFHDICHRERRATRDAHPGVGLIPLDGADRGAVRT
jgi:hypothetical protein